MHKLLRAQQSTDITSSANLSYITLMTNINDPCNLSSRNILFIDYHHDTQVVRVSNFIRDGFIFLQIFEWPKSQTFACFPIRRSPPSSLIISRRRCCCQKTKTAIIHQQSIATTTAESCES
jgi:hypothetical protein